MNQLTREERAKIIACLVEGCSLRSTVRMTGFSKKAVTRLQREIGQACAEYHDKHVRNLTCVRLQVDEVWSFTYCKQKNIPLRLAGNDEIGDTWTWVGICPDTKLIVGWYVGKRDATDAYWFIHDLAERLKNRIQLTSDGHKAYLQPVEEAFGSEIDYAMLIKLFGNEVPASPETRYSPPVCIGTRKSRIAGNPDPNFVSTSICERQNLTMRMQMRRFTRLTNGFSKKLQNHKWAIALHYVHYNFCRIHSSLRVTPSMEAGISDRVWSTEDLAALLEK